MNVLNAVGGKSLTSSARDSEDRDNQVSKVNISYKRSVSADRVYAIEKEGGRRRGGRDHKAHAQIHSSQFALWIRHDIIDIDIF